VCDPTPHFPISQLAISPHLALLREAGLVTGRRDGRLVCCRMMKADDTLTKDGATQAKKRVTAVDVSW
jgi:DNA-binding transcriptional ArsR family regulator